MGTLSKLFRPGYYAGIIVFCLSLSEFFLFTFFSNILLEKINSFHTLEASESIRFLMQIASLTLIVAVIIIEPGIIPNQLYHPRELRKSRFLNQQLNKYIVNRGNLHKLRVCSNCLIIKVGHISHCYLCNSCIIMKDHHCAILGNCIGIRNYWAFYCTLLVNTTISFLELVEILLFVLSYLDNIRETSFLLRVCAFAFIALFSLKAVFVIMLTALHSINSFTQRTSKEQSKRYSPINRSIITKSKVLFSY